MNGFKRAALSALILAAGWSVGETENPPPPAPGAPGDRYVHQPDVASIVKRFLSPEGFMDPEFPPTIAAASPFYTDFFGLQAIADVSRDKILADFVPQHAAQVASDEHSVTLRFNKGYVATFYPQSSLRVMGVTVPFSHVAFSGDDWRTARGNVGDFLSIVKAAQRSDVYLIANPCYADEQVTAEQFKTGTAAPIVVDPRIEAFDSAASAVLLMPEAVHGHRENADALMALLRDHKVDWLGLEMLNADQQRDLDAFSEAKEGTPQYRAARAKLVDYFAGAWNGRAGPKTTGEENYYFQLVEAAHKNGVRLIGLEAASMPYILFRYGETPFGASVRNYQWASHSPAKGRGVIFGGGSHFNLPGTANVQDFLAVRDRGRTFVSLKDLKAKPGS